MPRTITVPDALFERWQKLAIPLVDDLESMLGKMTTFYAEHHNGAGQIQSGPQGPKPQPFNPLAPPDLTHTRVLAAELNGAAVEKGLLWWNKMLDHLVQLARKNVATSEELKRLIIVNSVTGKKDDMGYHFLPDAGVSIQGQDANGAWKAILHILKNFGWTLDVVFVWANKEGLSNSGVTGRMAFGK